MAVTKTQIVRRDIIRQIIAVMEEPFDRALILQMANGKLPSNARRFDRYEIKCHLNNIRRQQKNKGKPILEKRGEKVTKSSILREVIVGMLHPYDYKKILTLCNNRIAQLPKEERPKSFNIDTIGAYCSPSQQKKTAHLLNGSNHTVPSAARETMEHIPIRKPAPDSFSQMELVAARRYLESNGDSLHRSIELLKLVSILIASEGK